jgi:cation:H+ antiporter
MSIIELLLSPAAILGAAVIFTNAVGILGDRLGLGHGAVWSILAAVGTALPETMILSTAPESGLPDSKRCSPRGGG